MNVYETIITEPFLKFYEKLLLFLPNFLISIFILIVGIAFGFLLKNLFSRLFKAIGLDKVSERSGVVELMKKGGMEYSLYVLLARYTG